MGANPRLAALLAAGTSPWLDQLRRSTIEGGELARMVEEDSLRGVTSSSAGFATALLGASDYDDELLAGAREGLGARELHRRIAVRDAQRAADVLRPLYAQGGGRDGFVSLELAPGLAHDTGGTLEQARQYSATVDRPNLMIRIPATPAGIRAAEIALFEGMHVEHSLLFSVGTYREVIDAHLRAMERRHADGRPLDRHSVASFCVAPVDCEVDRRLEAIGRPELAGRAGLAVARAAHRAFREVYGGARFAALRDAGCPVQRPLWACTAVKNPFYPETLYVDGLVGPDTVITLAPATLLAFAGLGAPQGGSAAIDPGADLQALAEAGVDLADVATRLLREAIEALAAADPLDAIERRRAALLAGHPSAAVVAADLAPELERAVLERMGAAAEADVARRLWDRTLWGPEAGDRLGWLTVGGKLLDDAPALRELADECEADGLTDCVVLGTGTASLAPEVLRPAGQAARGLTLHVLDLAEPSTVAAVRDAVQLSRTLFVVATRSGVTRGTLALFHYFHALQPDGAHYVAVTGPGSPLLELAVEHGFRRAFVDAPDIGARHSVRSYFGLVPAALAGVDVEVVLQASAVAEHGCAELRVPGANPGLRLGILLGELARQGRDKPTLLVDPPLQALGRWIARLIGEATAAGDPGLAPVADEPPLAIGAYGLDRVFVHLRNEAATEASAHAGRLSALAAAGHPTVTIAFSGPEDLGRLCFLTEFATAVAGWVLGVDPFAEPDEPAEAESGDARSGVADGDLAELIDGRLEPPHHLVITGFLPAGEATDVAVGRLRRTVAERHGVATTFGSGRPPRGGSAHGHFLQLVHDAPADLEIDGRGFGFRALLDAQADADLQALRHLGLPAARVRLPAGDLPGAIDALSERI